MSKYRATRDGQGDKPATLESVLKEMNDEARQFAEIDASKLKQLDPVERYRIEQWQYRKKWRIRNTRPSRR